MLNGVTITIVGMLTVFVFLAILVLAMMLLKWVAVRFLSGGAREDDIAVVAAALAAAVDADERGETE